MLNIETDRAYMLGIASVKPGILFADLDEVLVALKNHHESELVCEQMLRDDLVAVLALLALCVGLELFLSTILRLHIAVVARDWFIVDNHLFLRFRSGLFGYYKCLSVNIPPIPSFILNKVTYHLIESCPMEITLYKFDYVLYVF